MWLPRPYPDEIVGSVVMRGCRWSGLRLERYVRAVTGDHLSSQSMAAIVDEDLAIAGGKSLLEIAMQHTLLPYAVSFHPPHRRLADLESLVTVSKATSMGAVIQKLVRNIRRMKFCPDCSSMDLTTFGESYWHRKHQLDGALMCNIHHRTLHVSTVNVTTRHPLFPADLTRYSNELSWKVAEETAIALTTLVEDALDWRIERHADLRTHYREAVKTQGYILGGRKLAAGAFAKDLASYYGADLLQYLGCPIRLHGNTAWTERMLRHEPECFSPIRHGLMMVFLDTNPRPSVDLKALVHAPRPKRVDYRALEDQMMPILVSAVLKNLEKGECTPIQPLLNSLGIGSLIKHKRHLLPRIDQWMQETRVSNCHQRWDTFRAQ